MMDLQSLKQADRNTLKDHWFETIGNLPPSRISSKAMARILISDLQWKQSGQSRASVLRKLRKIASTSLVDKPVAGSGTRLVREWNGHEHVVDVMTDGYLWNGKRWRSLSAVAKEITGAKWSGPRFFGVTV